MPAAQGDGDRNTGRERKRIAAALGVAGALALLVWLCSYTVYTGEYALVTEFGKPVKVVTTPGLRFKLPYRNVRSLDARLFAYTPAATEFLTLEKTPVIAGSTVLWRISDPKKVFQTVFDRAGAESRLGDILFSELGAAVGRNPLLAFVSVQPGAYRAEAILDQVTEHCREIAYVIRMLCGAIESQTEEQETAAIIGTFLQGAAAVEGHTTFEATGYERFQAAAALRRDFDEAGYMRGRPTYLVDTKTDELVIPVSALSKAVRDHLGSSVARGWLDGRMDGLGWQRITIDGHEDA